jgi:predicted DsbA family dithiol-disulfide isomerase
MEAVQACKLPHIGGLAASDELDAALRQAFYEEDRCISVHPFILNVAVQCPHLDVDALAAALEEGTGRAAVYAQWLIAQQASVTGSPHLFTVSGVDECNPGATYHWSGTDEERQLHLDEYRTGWADELLASSNDRPARNTLP